MSNDDERRTRIIIRRINRQTKQDRLLTVKILSLWILCAFVVFLVATIFIKACVDDTVLWRVFEAVCIVLAAVVMVLATLERIEQLKKSHRCRNTRTGHMQK